jgi:hypothetical protein
MATEIDKELQTTLKQAKAGRPMQFAFLGKGPGGKLLAAKKLAPNLIAEAKKAEGGTLFKGRLFGEDGTLVFEVAKEPPATLAAQLKRCIKEHAALTGEVVVRVKADAEADLEPGAAPGQVQVLRRLQELMPMVQGALAGPDSARVQALLGAVKGLIDNQDFAQAGRVLDELEPLVTKAAPAAPAPHPPPPRPGDPQKAAVMKRLNGMGAAIKAELGGPNGSRVQALFVGAGGLIKNGDFDQAVKVLDQLETLLKQATKGPPLVVLQQTRLAWDKTRKTIQAELQKLETAILTACEGDEEVDVAEISGRLKGLYTILDQLDTRLIDKLDEALNAPDAPQRDQLNQQAKSIVNEYLVFVNSDPLVADVDDSGFGAVAVRKTALSALNLLASKL